MIDAVFISDLHLNPEETVITERFFAFINWTRQHARALYILGDFFHVWPGDDALNAWSESIADRLAGLVSSGVAVYFMPGNRDFLVGERFATRARISRLTEPAIIQLGDARVLLVHGDRYCTQDKGHQWLRRITRNAIFSKVFLALPYCFRQKLVNKVRQRSQTNRRKTMAQMDVVDSSLLSHMQRLKVRVVVHGHTHKPGLTTHIYQGETYQQYVLSDWDDSPQILNYNGSNEFKFEQFQGC